MKYYLKPNVVIEPLIDGWYAWSHLISPATAAMNVDGRHLPIIDSYLGAPEVHAQAVLNPKMRGGPFMDLGGVKVDEVRKLKDKIVDSRSMLLQLAKSIKELDKMLATEAKGFGMENVYPKVPDSLKGYVELFYDRSNNPGFRFFESLLYKSEFYCTQMQSIALWITENDQRPFCLSTPKLPDSNSLILDMTFDSVIIDELAKMKRTPQPLNYIKNLFSIAPSDEMVFDSFFTTSQPPVYSPYVGDKIRMRYFGHACILIETNELSILIDPLISYYGYHSDIEHFSDVDLPDKIDYVLITHNHQDHILFETLLPLRHKIGKIIVPSTRSGRLEDPDLKLMFNSIGFKNVVAIDEMETLNLPDCLITAIPFTGEHSDLNILTKSCYLVQIREFKLLFMADSRILDSNLYRSIQKQIGNVDVMFLGMECDGAPLSWLYGPLLTKKLPRDQDGSRRLAGSDCKKGMSIVDIFSPNEVYVYAMGLEPWVEFISSVKYTDESNPIVQSNELVRLCRERGMIAERLFGEKEILYNKSGNEVRV